MKKSIILLTIIASLTACQNNTQIDNTIEEVTEITPTITEKVDEYIDDNPITVGLYQNGKLIKNLETTIKDDLDIASFDVYFTNKETLDSSNTKYNYKKYYQEYENIDDYKIGFYIKFEVGNKIMEGKILDPSSMYIVTPYIYNYLYDDIHQADGTWYNHVEEKDVKDDTIYSSIKLYGAEFTENITSPITLTVFTYNSQDDFDKDGNYRGNSKYTVTISRK